MRISSKVMFPVSQEELTDILPFIVFLTNVNDQDKLSPPSHGATKHGAHCDRPSPAQSVPAFYTLSKCIQSNGHPPTATGPNWAVSVRSAPIRPT
ncbi:hypothetical protein J6590_007536 [Homalodisca vitripennis]|nr:hypothetical protein J6590_007536 [Homalodisca vitripennis]